MPALSSPRRSRVAPAASVLAVGLLALTGCAGASGAADTGTGGAGAGSTGPSGSSSGSVAAPPAASPSASPSPTTSATPAAPEPGAGGATGADALPFGQEQWMVESLTRDGKAVATGPWTQAFIETDKPFMFAAPELCSQPRFGITTVSETAWEATHDVAQPAIACGENAPGQKAVGALWELFDGTVEVTPPAGAGMEMRLERGDVVLVLGVEG